MSNGLIYLILRLAVAVVKLIRQFLKRKHPP